jgi:hypothetical protein
MATNFPINIFLVKPLRFLIWFSKRKLVVITLGDNLFENLLVDVHPNEN